MRALYNNLKMPGDPREAGGVREEPAAYGTAGNPRLMLMRRLNASRRSRLAGVVWEGRSRETPPYPD
jgi:hypothetical protein